MMGVKQMDYRKRQLLKRSAYTILLSTLIPLPVVGQLKKYDAVKRQFDLNPSLDSMRAIGREYLKKYPNEYSRSYLLSLLQSSTGSKDDGLNNDFWDGLRTAVENDFQTEDVVFLNDWCLARTEARLCALAVV